jgi:acyl-CoA thioester hydrolase
VVWFDHVQEESAMTPHTFPVRVYYEDTDLAGIVYYANYLKFIERGRSEWVRARGLDQRRLKAEQGIVFAVRRVEADYLSPARFDDELTVETVLEGMTAARLHLRQQVRRGDAVLFSALVTLVALREDGSPARIGTDLRSILAAPG